MVWTIKINKKSKKELSKLGKQIQIKIIGFLFSLGNTKNPRSKGHALKGGLALFWRCRVGDYRIICDIKDDDIIVLVLSVGHKIEVYRK